MFILVETLSIWLEYEIQTATLLIEGTCFMLIELYSLEYEIRTATLLIEGTYFMLVELCSY